MPVWLTSIGAKIAGYLGLTIVALGLLLKVKSDFETDGANKLSNQIHKDDAKTQTKYDQIDSSSLSVDDALDRLSKRSK